MARLCCRHAVVAIVLGTALLGSARLEAQSVAAPDLTAAFLLNFVRFTTWPAEALGAGATIVVCVSGNDWVANSLNQLTRNQRVDGRRLEVQLKTLDQPLSTCHMVYGAALDGQRAQQLIEATSGRPILTVSDATDFAERGGVANFYIEGGRMRFAVNPGAAEQARLQLSSKLLSLARIVNHGKGS